MEAEKQPKKEVKVKKAKQRQELIVEEGMKKFVATQAIGLRALLEMTSRESLSVTEVVAHDKAQEFLPDQAPFQEFVQIENMLKSGVTVDQIVTLGAIGNLPVLTAPETQKALVRLVEDQGFRAVVLQVYCFICLLNSLRQYKFISKCLHKGYRQGGRQTSS